MPKPIIRFKLAYMSGLTHMKYFVEGSCSSIITGPILEISIRETEVIRFETPLAIFVKVKS